MCTQVKVQLLYLIYVQEKLKKYYLRKSSNYSIAKSLCFIGHFFFHAAVCQRPVSKKDTISALKN